MKSEAERKTKPKNYETLPGNPSNLSDLSVTSRGLRLHIEIHPFQLASFSIGILLYWFDGLESMTSGSSQVLASAKYLEFPVFMKRFSSFLVVFDIVLSAFLLSGTARAQSPVTVSGIVTDADSDEVLVGANVHFIGAVDTGAATDLAGRYSLLLPPGTYRVEVTFIGYDSWMKEDYVVPSESQVLDVRLDLGNQLINPITITASRRPERLLDSPASIVVLEPRELESRTALTAASHLTAVPALDLVTTGLVSSRIAIRGFNDNLSSSLLTMVDNRIASAPSVRLTALQLIPMTNGDIDQIEVVTGPASALYGPNAANGVIHMLTKSPFDSQGTSLSLAAGQQDVLLGSIRHAGTLGSRFGYKVLAQYYTGNEYEYSDPEELLARSQALTAGARADTLLIGARDFDVRNLALNTRLDYRFPSGATLILSAGVTRGNNIEITPTGAAQVENARISYGQLRFQSGRFFAQAYGNLMNSGTSYFLRTGELFRDVSRLFVAQVQHYTEVSASQRFTYGLDAFYTLPEGEGTINGRNEDSDNVSEVGIYLQSETRVNRRLSLHGAARVDYHDKLDTYTFSPRAAIVFKPAEAHTARITYNQAFRTPLPNDLFSDILGRADFFTLGQLEPLLGFAPTTDLRVQGMVDGFSFQHGANSAPRFRSPFAPLDPRGLTTSDYIDLHDSTFTNVMWDVARQSTVAGLADNLVAQGIIDVADAPAISNALDEVLPTSLTNVTNALQLLDLDSQAFVPVSGVKDFPKLKVTRTRTLEAGYKGLIGRRIVVSIDLYHTQVSNFLGPFVVGTPNVFLDGPSLHSELIKSLRDVFADPGNSEALAALQPLDDAPQLFGNGDGDPSSEIALIVATGVAGAIPFGTVSPDEAFDPTAVMLMRQNFGEVTVNGADMNVMMFLSRRMRVGVMYSWLSDNFFRNVDGVDHIALNSPRHKGGAQFYYESADGQIGFSVRGRYVEGFPVRSDVYVGAVEGFFVVDSSVNYRVPFSKNTQVNLTIQNLTDNKHREFVFVPEIGRLALLRLTHEF